MSTPAGSGCPFCPPATPVVASNGTAFAIRDAFPVNLGHTLILPRRHFASWFDASAEERQAILDLVEQVKLDVDREFAPAGYNIGINDGQAAGQTVMHLHVHLIPRYRGDVDDPAAGLCRDEDRAFACPQIAAIDRAGRDRANVESGAVTRCYTLRLKSIWQRNDLRETVGRNP